MDLGYLASSEDQKVEMIISLQGEVERLQARLDRDLGDDESPEGQLMRKNTELESENKRLKDELRAIQSRQVSDMRLMQEELENERLKVLKATKILSRLRFRRNDGLHNE